MRNLFHSLSIKLFNIDNIFKNLFVVFLLLNHIAYYILRTMFGINDVSLQHKMTFRQFQLT